MSAICKAYRLNIIPYGPAGIELIPNGFRNIMQAIDNIVETTDDTRMNDWHQLAFTRILTEYLRGPNDLSVSLTHTNAHLSICTPTLYSNTSAKSNSVELANASG